MNLTKKTFIRWALLSVTILLAAVLAGVVLTRFGYLGKGIGAHLSLNQIIGLAVLTAVPAVMLAAYRLEFHAIAGMAVVASNFILPLFLTDESFRYSMPQAIWLPFILSLVLCSIPWVILSFATTLAVLFSFFTLANLPHAVSTALVTAIIFIALTLYKLLQESLIANSLTAEKAAKASAAALRKSEERYRAVFQNTIDSISVMRIEDGTYLEANDAFYEMTGYAPNEIIGRSQGARILWENHADLEKVESLLSQDGEVRNFETRFKRKDGGSFWGLMSSRLIDIEGVRCRIAITRDVTEQKEADELIHRLAYFDQLTQLPNRIQFVDQFQQATQTQRQNNVFGALLLIDIDDFKILNDTRGHEIGDLLLTQVAERLLRCVQPNDFVARFGGDEFIVMLADLGSVEKIAMARAETISKSILSILRQDFLLGAGIYRSTGSIGVCLFSRAQTGIETLLKRVELAMYKAKRDGRNLVRFFDPEMEVAIEQRANLENNLRDAIHEQQFILHYQAQVTDSQLIGAEVLARWQHPERGMVSPAEFIPLAEESGLIIPLGLWVLEEACFQLANWGREPKLEHLTLAVNVSIQQFNQADFVDRVLDVIQRTGANPRRLKLELTESLMASNVSVIIEKMRTLRSEGIQFSLDDFGTGYSSLSYLKSLPIDQLKIDQSFVRDLLENPDDVAITKTIIKLGQNMGLGIIAEGVETSQHQTFLAKLGCKVYQGYLFGRPIPITQFELRQDFRKLRD